MGRGKNKTNNKDKRTEAKGGNNTTQAERHTRARAKHNPVRHTQSVPFAKSSLPIKLVPPSSSPSSSPPPPPHFSFRLFQFSFVPLHAATISLASRPFFLSSGSWLRSHLFLSRNTTLSVSVLTLEAGPPAS
eukprot:m.143288 g.143288  ORF g.143288 m.143288 type:complete len:132 (-) comp20431_c1_seq5:673-1068(-)